MRQAADKQYTHSHVVTEDGTVTFQCSSDHDQWPWLALPPFDPIVVQTINFWASVETATARGTWDPDKWSALTEMEWTCGEAGAGHAVHGIGETLGKKGSPRFQLRFFDADEALVYVMSGKGVVFETRDFEAWRAKAKEEAATVSAPSDFHYAAAEAVGLVSQNECFLSSLVHGQTATAQALITSKNGFPPGHPYQSGSGDHVNATHLADAGRQFVNLLRGEKPHTITGGQMTFKHYVELGRPFDLIQRPDECAPDIVSILVEQADRPCATMKLRHD